MRNWRTESVARLAQTVLPALTPSYADYSPTASIGRGVFISPSWGARTDISPAHQSGVHIGSSLITEIDFLNLRNGQQPTPAIFAIDILRCMLLAYDVMKL
jgi:hypothetical protein